MVVIWWYTSTSGGMAHFTRTDDEDIKQVKFEVIKELKGI